MKTFKEVWCAAVAATMAGAAVAAPRVQVPCTEGYRADRLMRTIVAPREAIDLQGTWLTAHTACKQTDTEKIELLNGKTYERKVMTSDEPDEKAVWSPAESPFVEGLSRGSCLWAKRTFTAPKLGGRRALLRFESIEDGFTVFVNGKAYPQTAEPGYGLSWVRDITEAVKPLLKETKCTLTFTDELVIIGDRYYVKSTATITNAAGEKIDAVAYAREPEQKKGMDGGVKIKNSGFTKDLQEGASNPIVLEEFTRMHKSNINPVVDKTYNNTNN